MFILPGLCGPVADSAAPGYLQDRPRALDRLFSRSQVMHTGCLDLVTVLCRWFGLQGEQLPVAALTCLSDTGQPCAKYVMRADPVHLRADQSHLRLFDSRAFPVTQEEADALIATFNKFYADRGWQLSAPHPQRWYLSLPEATQITTVPLARVAGGTIDSCLPQGAAAAAWHATLNEVQMLFHDHAVNVAREQRGEPVINSLWFWGEGELSGKLQTEIARLVTDHPLGMGLAQLGELPRLDLPADVDELLALPGDGKTLLVDDVLDTAAQYREWERWEDQLLKLEKEWFAPLLEALRQGEITSLEIDPCQGNSFTVTGRQLQKFWIRTRPFEWSCQHAG